MISRFRRMAAVVLLAIVSSSHALGQPAVSQDASAAWGKFGVGLEGMDPTVHPGDDFWEYVNGTWARNTEIPADKSGTSQVARLSDLAAAQVRNILDDYARLRSGLLGDERRVADYWSSVLDEAAIERRGRAPLDSELGRIRAASNKTELAREMGMLMTRWVPTPSLGMIPRYFPGLFNLSISQDSREPTRYGPRIRQSGLGMPSRDYYLKSDADSRRIQEAYRRHIGDMLRLVGVSPRDADRRAVAVYDFERSIAEAHWPVADSRDFEKTYNKWSFVDLEQRAPGFDWTAFFDAASLGRGRDVIVAEASAISGMAGLFKSTPLPVLQDWLSVRITKDRAAVLPQAFRSAEFAFSAGVLGGASEPPERWLQAVELTAVALTDAVSKPYVERHFPAATKQSIEQLVSHVIEAMDRRLANLEWMQPHTKEKARAKLKTFRVMIGHPDTWRSYDGLDVSLGDAYGNFLRSAAYEYDRKLKRIDSPVDRNEWFMLPITANAYASSGNNQIVFTAAYLQPPHFDPNADPAVNYGAIGWVIGHEISHHFDDQGSRFDAHGRMVSWWTEEDRRAFQERAERLVAQYDSYEALPGLRIRGKQTLSENIADNAGLAIAYDAYRSSLAGKSPPLIDGFTGDQRFFLGRAQMHRSIQREEEVRRGVLSGNYAPGRWRTWSVRNHDAWYDAFGVTPLHRLYLAPEERVRIW